MVRDVDISSDSKPHRAAPGNTSRAKGCQSRDKSPQTKHCWGFVLPWSFPFLLQPSLDFPLPCPFPASPSLGNENPILHLYFSLHRSPSPLSACAPTSSPPHPLTLCHHSPFTSISCTPPALTHPQFLVLSPPLSPAGTPGVHSRRERAQSPFGRALRAGK